MPEETSDAVKQFSEICQKHNVIINVNLAVAVLYIIRLWHTGKKAMRKRKSLSVKQIVIITVTGPRSRKSIGLDNG